MIRNDGHHHAGVGWNQRSPGNETVRRKSQSDYVLGDGQQAMVIDAIQAGARDFIVKPFQPEKVMEAVMKAMG